MTVEAVGAENYGTISYVAESPHKKGVLWTGSDDGLVHLTMDGGKKWTNVTPQDLEECLVNAIEISPHDKGTVYIATTRYKFDDKKPSLYKTTNYGESWTKITDGIPDGSFTRVVREDEDRKGLLFAGTETGLYVSFNGGKKWEAFQLNLPVTPILDLAVRHGDLIAATSGRSFWILDDLGLIRQRDEREKDFHLFEPESAVLSNHGSELNSTSESFNGANAMRGVNPASGVVVYYNLPEMPKSDEDDSDDEKPDDKDELNVELEIQNSNGKTINKFSSKEYKDFNKYEGGPPSPTALPNKKGLNRFVWNMRHQNMPGIPIAYIEASYRGHKVAPGEYKLILTLGDKTSETMVEIKPNPLYPTTKKQYDQYDQAMSEMEESLTEMHRTTNQLFKVQTQIRNLLETLTKDKDVESLSEINKQGEELVEKLKSWDEDMVQRKSKAYDDVENFPNKFTAEYLMLINQTESDIPRVTQGSIDRRAELDSKWQKLKKQAQALLKTDLPKFNKQLWAKKIGAIWARE